MPSFSVPLFGSFRFLLLLYGRHYHFSTKRNQTDWPPCHSPKCIEPIPVQCVATINTQHWSNSTHWHRQTQMTSIPSSLFRHTSHVSVVRASPGLSSDCCRFCWPLLICFVTFRRSLFKMREVVITSDSEAQSAASHSLSQHRAYLITMRVYFSCSSLCVKRLTRSASAQMLTKWKHVSCLDLVRLWQWLRLWPR